MDKTTLKFLHEINNRFYQEQGASFAQTRGAPWHGWKQCLEVLSGKGARNESRELSVLDVACGNRRFEAFLRQSLPLVELSYYGLDNSNEMSGHSDDERGALSSDGGTTDLERNDDSCNSTASNLETRSHYQDLDILSLLIEGNVENASSAITAPDCEIVTSFGFMHHIPSQNLRRELIEVLINKTQDKGFIAISFWQFMKSDSLARKAEETHKLALQDFRGGPDQPERSTSDGSPQNLESTLENGDYFLGWQGKESAYRYCHNFSELEISELAEMVSDRAKVLAQFEADGRTQNLNHYLILQKR
jgi:SAM-dependent methyltransferase